MNPRNPFYVLELGSDATPAEIERQGRKLLGLLELGSAKANAYASPVGRHTRDATMVRDAMAALRDPKRRARERCLAAVLERTATPDAIDEDMDSPLRDAFDIVYRGL